jgi:hypothetical protein
MSAVSSTSLSKENGTSCYRRNGTKGEDITAESVHGPANGRFFRTQGEVLVWIVIEVAGVEVSDQLRGPREIESNCSAGLLGLAIHVFLYFVVLLMQGRSLQWNGGGIRSCSEGPIVILVCAMRRRPVQWTCVLELWRLFGDHGFEETKQV